MPATDDRRSFGENPHPSAAEGAIRKDEAASQPNRHEVISLVVSYAAYRQDLAELLLIAKNYRLANRTSSSAEGGMEEKLHGQLSQSLELAVSALTSLTQQAFAEMIACMKATQKLPQEDQLAIYGFELSRCDLSGMRDGAARDFDQYIEELRAHDSLGIEGLFEHVLCYLCDFFELDDQY